MFPVNTAVIRLLPGVRSTAFFAGTYMVSLDDLAGIVTSTVVPLLTVDSTAFNGNAAYDRLPNFFR